MKISRFPEELCFLKRIRHDNVSVRFSPMNRTICPLKYVVSGICCALAFGLVENSFGQQTLPPIIPVNVPNFTIPFEIEESANSIREVELFVSKDRGRRWTSVARQPVETGKFAFRADSDGEYWFAFRTAALNESVAPIGGQPHLRVSVNIREPIIILPSQPSESGPLTPPKPERFRGDNVARATPKPTISENVVETKPSGEPDTGGETDSNEAETKPVQKKPETGQFLAPKLPGFEP
ncbi:MAG: hypothetical protein LBI05_11945, partial [Planctomycetaceae bacterium]|nr:hypothetical protein [Planctomycetaceae bacterium]